ncbi:MAG: hypothetical protein KDI36_06125, partial [Pseudomonadales bacterium]|nr:hypothetical protein [Pseudomonadales bacterium]
MWLNSARITDQAIEEYRRQLSASVPRHVVIDDLFNADKLTEIVAILRQPQRWKVQRHTYAALYVDDDRWEGTRPKNRFVSREAWQREAGGADANVAQAFLSFLRSPEFMSVLSRIFAVALSDANVADPEINTNYFRIDSNGFV